MSSDPPPGGGRIGSQPPLSCNKVRGYERTPLPTRGCPPQNYKEVGRCLLIPPSPGWVGGSAYSEVSSDPPPGGGGSVRSPGELRHGAGL